MTDLLFDVLCGLLAVSGSLGVMCVRRSVVAQTALWALAAFGCAGAFAAAAAPVVAALFLFSVLAMCGGALLLVDSESQFAEADLVKLSTSRVVIRFLSAVAVWVGVVLWAQEHLRAVSWLEFSSALSTNPPELTRGEALAGWFLGSAPSTALACGSLCLVAILAPFVLLSKEEVE